MFSHFRITKINQIKVESIYNTCFQFQFKEPGLEIINHLSLKPSHWMSTSTSPGVLNEPKAFWDSHQLLNSGCLMGKVFPEAPEIPLLKC